MRYYTYADEDAPIGGGTTYIETDDGCAIRQITVNGDEYLASNCPYPPWGLCLAEGQIDYDSLEDAVTEISQAEFETIWQKHLATHQSQWLTSKRKYPTGTAVQGWIEIFFPQGVIVNLGDGTLGVADDARCRASSAPEWMASGNKVTAIVSGYDEVNHWLVLDHPQVVEERIDNKLRS
jgi:hypothetical protein